MAVCRTEKILILAKTYPSPSAQYMETSCVAGINQDGVMRRLYPVPFRMIEDGQQFKKWQWIDVIVEKANKDHRPESHKLYVDTISCGDLIETKREWVHRRKWLDKIPTFTSFDALEADRLSSGLSLALLRPKQLLRLEVSKAKNQDWTDDEREKLAREQMQGNLFSEVEVKKEVKTLKKVPYDFHYWYLCDTPDGEKEFKNKIVDWEAGALYWNCVKSYRTDWETQFRKKLEEDFASKDLMFLMGNQHRFQDQWLIISLIYPPKQKTHELAQSSLF
ncbi:hypothetical protein [Herbaspirillum frisingense]|nr:hypothetical protein [Herbaspirillum frisingense]